MRTRNFLLLQEITVHRVTYKLKPGTMENPLEKLIKLL